MLILITPRKSVHLRQFYPVKFSLSCFYLPFFFILRISHLESDVVCLLFVTLNVSTTIGEGQEISLLIGGLFGVVIRLCWVQCPKSIKHVSFRFVLDT